MILRKIIGSFLLLLVTLVVKAQDPTPEYFAPVSRYQTHFIKPHKIFSFGVSYNPGNKWIKAPYYVGFDLGRIRVTKRSAIMVSLNLPFGFKHQVNKLDGNNFVTPGKEVVACNYFAPRLGAAYSYGFAIPCYISAKAGVTKAWEKAQYRLVEDDIDFIAYKENNHSPIQPYLEFELYGYFNTKNIDSYRFGWSVSTLIMPMHHLGKPLSYNVGFFWSGLSI